MCAGSQLRPSGLNSNLQNFRWYSLTRKSYPMDQDHVVQNMFRLYGGIISPPLQGCSALPHLILPINLLMGFLSLCCLLSKKKWNTFDWTMTCPVRTICQNWLQSDDQALTTFPWIEKPSHRIVELGSKSRANSELSPCALLESAEGERERE